MANRIIPTATKVNAMNQCLVLQNVEPVAKELGVASNSIRNWFATKALPGLPEALAKEHPGPKPKVTPRPTRPALQSPDALSGSVSQGKRAALSMEVEERPDHCPQDCFACPYCQSSRVWKNGRYWVINWLDFPCTLVAFTSQALDCTGLRCLMPTRPASRPLIGFVFLKLQVCRQLCEASRPHLTMTPLLLANGWCNQPL